MKTLWINASTPYPLYIGRDLWTSSLFNDHCLSLNKRLVIITDSHLVDSLGIQLQRQLKIHGLDAYLIACPAGEAHKTRETKQILEDKLLAKQYGRDTCLIALGGGVITDLAGFLAATYCRGLPVIYIPTTLLAMVDASIGGKTGVNTPHGKNLIGTFTQPQAVFMDITMLTTLPENEWHNGMAEMIKHGVIADASIFERLEQGVEKINQRDPDFLIDMIHASCLIKKNIVEQDEHEQGLRQILNFGHTIGHAIETLEHYRVSHGEAVAIGMLVEAYLSVLQGYLIEEDLVQLESILRDYGLPLQTSAFQDKKQLIELLMLDKKSVNNKARFVLLDNIGTPHYQDGYAMPVDSQSLHQALDWAAIRFQLSSHQ